ncbi:tripartite motif containing 13 [Parelaphostrongylus tenuis]|uniref:Tripartite motif containing 13 n=1 Tax=Parelaphostrongylus tenuis TaxID=148309 RepID=A0AAD5M3M5_PARTN|nr:tripartite motif containing 13 [Parelaphostrongylus tenuis]
MDAPEQPDTVIEHNAPEQLDVGEEHDAPEVLDVPEQPDVSEEHDTSEKRDRIQDLLECVICTVRMKRPTQLSCGHTFCLECIEQMVDGEQVLCPECRQPTQIPPGGLPLNYYALNVIAALNENLQNQNRTQKNSCYQCSSRIEGGIHYLCRSCKKNFLCAVCCLKDHRGHKIEEKRAATSSEIKNTIEAIDGDLASVLHTIQTVEDLWDFSSLHAALVERSDATLQAYEQIMSNLNSGGVLCDQLNSTKNTAMDIKSLFTSLCNKIEVRQKKMVESCLSDIADFSTALEKIMVVYKSDFNDECEI